MAAVLKAQDKFSFDDLTQSIFQDLVEQAADDTNTCNAIVFRADHVKHHALIDELVISGFIIHDKEQNSYRLYTPFLRVLESVFFSALLDDLNRLLHTVRDVSSGNQDNSCDLYRLSAQTEISPERVASLTHYLYWLGMIAAPVSDASGESRIVCSEYAHRFESIEDCMDHLLQIFDVSKNTPHGAPKVMALNADHYSTPMLELLHETMDSYFAGREFSEQPEKGELIEKLREKSVNGKKISKKMAEAIYEILHTPNE